MTKVSYSIDSLKMADIFKVKLSNAVKASGMGILLDASDDEIKALSEITDINLEAEVDILEEYSFWYGEKGIIYAAIICEEVSEDEILIKKLYLKEKSAGAKLLYILQELINILSEDSVAYKSVSYESENEDYVDYICKAMTGAYFTEPSLEMGRIWAEELEEYLTEARKLESEFENEYRINTELP